MTRYSGAGIVLICLSAVVAACAAFHAAGDLDASRAPDASDAPNLSSETNGSSQEVGVGDGHSGSRTISGVEVINEYAALTADTTAGKSVRVDPEVSFVAGDAVLLWQTTGLAGAASGDRQAVVLANGVGRYEVARVERATLGEVVLTRPLSGLYRVPGAQVIRVPEFQNLTVTATGVVAGAAWDGRRGGIVAVFVREGLHNDGMLRADALGFRGGRTYQRSSNISACTVRDGMPKDGYAAKGESFFPGGFSPVNDGGAVGGPGNLLSGGGGGGCQNAGGGGGGNGGEGGQGAPGGPARDAGYAGYDGRSGMGGAGVSASLFDQLVFGGGGGAGDQNNAAGVSNGGNGGGVVFMRVGTIDGTGVVSADGEGVGAAGWDGAGGGGAGGSVLIRVMSTARCRVSARGANGGDNYSWDPLQAPGGGGGGGRVLVQGAPMICPIDVVSGLAGTQVVDGGMMHAGANPETNEPGQIEASPSGGYIP